MVSSSEIRFRASAAALLVTSTDWGATSLGPMEAWSSRVLAVVETAMSSGFPLCVLLGPSPQGARLVYNDAFAPLLGRKHPWALGQRARDVWPETWDFFEWALRQVWQAGQPVTGKDIVLLVDRGNGLEEMYASISFSPIRDEEGVVCGALVCGMETTSAVLDARRERALRLLGDALRDAGTVEELFAAVSQTLRSASKDIVFALLYELDPQGNRASLRAFTGLAAEAPKALSEVDVAPGAAWEMEHVVRTREVRLVPTAGLGLSVMTALAGPPRRAAVVPVMGCSRHESPAAVLVVGLPTRGHDDALRCFVLRVAHEISASLDHLRSLDEAQRRAEAMAELDRAKTRFLTNVSHELRTPLTLIIGPVEDMLEGDALSAEARVSLAHVRRNSYRLLRHVNALLDFARVDARSVTVFFEPTDLAALTREIACAFEPAIARAGLRFSVDCPALPAPVLVIPEAWEQIVLNLLSNALKFTFCGEIALTLRAEGARASLTVQDTGVGISEDAVPRLFERFYRAAGSPARTQEGMGIGLALVKELAEAHGGGVRARSVKGEGSAFIVEIPSGRDHLPRERVRAPRPVSEPSTRDLAPFVEDALGLTVEPLRGPRDAPSQGLSGRILVAEDSDDLRAYLVRLLGASYEVIAAPTGAAALAAARASAPDLVLADVLMPELDGLELLRALRADPATSHIPVVLLSARAGEDATVDALGSGADDYLVKPFSARELRARVRTHLELSRARREACESRLKDMFLGIASHELRTPLTCLKLNVQLVHRQVEHIDERLAARLEGLNRSIDRMTRLVNEMLSVAAISAGKLALRETRCDLAEICRAAAAEQAQATRRLLTLRVPEEPVPIFADEDRIAEVVANLLANALKYSEADAPVVLALERSESEAIVTVRDNGPGIPADAIPHLFDRFYRVPGVGVRAGSYVGLGLGLFLSKAVIEQHEGRIWVDSEVGRGSAFSFSMKVAA